METPQQEYKHFVRIVNTDLDGSKPVKHAVTKIRGIGMMYANLVCIMAKVDKKTKVGELKQDEIERLNDVISNPQKYNAPTWLFNRRADPETGENKHLVSTDLRFTQENDLKLLKKIRSYKGVRHMLGLPVRGQKTRSKFRKNKGKVMGVKKSAAAKGK